MRIKKSLINALYGNRKGEILVPPRRRLNLISYVNRLHGDQKRKGTNLPYSIHLEAVAEFMDSYDGKRMFPVKYDHLRYECGYCHDVFEDTPINLSEFMEELIVYGYSSSEAKYIAMFGILMKKQFTKFGYRNLNRRERSNLETRRLNMMGPAIQLCKYYDIHHNVATDDSLLEYDSGFARLYLSEKLHQVDNGLCHISSKMKQQFIRKCRMIYKQNMQ